MSHTENQSGINIGTDGAPGVVHSTLTRFVNGCWVAETEMDAIVDASWQFSLFLALCTSALFFAFGVGISWIAIPSPPAFFQGIAVAAIILSIIFATLFAFLSIHEFTRRKALIQGLFRRRERERAVAASEVG